MKVVVSHSYEAMSKEALCNILEIIKDRPNPVICTASGDSPAGLYKELVEIVSKNQIDVSNWHFIGLDEWAGMNGNDNGSCRYHLNQQLYNPLKISEEQICFFDGRANSLEDECSKIENHIKHSGGIDVAIVGLGINGHVGMNEPGTSPLLKSHVADIDPLTQQVGQKYFKEQVSLEKGLTLGIASMMEARNVVLVVSGSKKAEILQHVLEGEISEQIPASLLRNHQSFFVFADKAAGLFLAHQDVE
jgi:galactosamine-6-phosphate isomerase